MAVSASANATATVATTGIMALATARGALQEAWAGIDLVNVTAEVAMLKAAARSPRALEDHWSARGLRGAGESRSESQRVKKLKSI